MRRVTLVFGSLAGITVSIFSIIIMSLCSKGQVSLDTSDLLGYGSMVIALSMIFFGIKSYRDNYQNGAISFARGLQVGGLITLIAALVYAAAGEIIYRADPAAQDALMDKYAEHHIQKIRDGGASPAEIDEKTREMADLKEMSRSPLLRLAMAIVIILPVGVVITLISAALLRKKEFLPE